MTRVKPPSNNINKLLEFINCACWNSLCIVICEFGEAIDSPKPGITLYRKYRMSLNIEDLFSYSNPHWYQTLLFML